MLVISSSGCRSTPTALTNAGTANPMRYPGTRFLGAFSVPGAPMERAMGVPGSVACLASVPTRMTSRSRAPATMRSDVEKPSQRMRREARGRPMTIRVTFWAWA